MCEEVTGSVTGSIGELMGEAPNMIVGGLLGIAAAVTLTFVFDNIVWIGLGVAVLTVAAIVWRGRKALAEHRAAPQSALWSPAKARTAPRPAIGAARPAVAGPARAALPEPQKALPAAAPVLGAKLAADLAELGVAIMAARPVISDGR